MNQNEFKKIISNAIQQEIEAFTYYNAVSDIAKDANLKKLFKDLAVEEDKHIGGKGKKYLFSCPEKCLQDIKFHEFFTEIYFLTFDFFI